MAELVQMLGLDAELAGDILNRQHVGRTGDFDIRQATLLRHATPPNSLIKQAFPPADGPPASVHRLAQNRHALVYRNDSRVPASP
jgi:hypothetical protein